MKNYVSNLLAKLGMGRRSEAAAYAARLEERRAAGQPPGRMTPPGASRPEGPT